MIDELPKGGCLGIDPGGTGGIAYAWDGGAEAWSIKKLTELDQWDRVFELSRIAKAAAIERVASRPGAGVAGMFKFGKSAGMLEGFLIASRVRYDWVTPVKWQTQMRCRSGGDKNVTKGAAQKLWPHLKITHATADSLLIADWTRCFADWAQ